jgi:hypothetical protein
MGCSSWTARYKATLTRRSKFSTFAHQSILVESARRFFIQRLIRPG